MYLQLFIATHVFAASPARYPRTHVACCENLPKFVQGKTPMGVPPPYCLPIHAVTDYDSRKGVHNHYGDKAEKEIAKTLKFWQISSNLFFSLSQNPSTSTRSRHSRVLIRKLNPRFARFFGPSPVEIAVAAARRGCRRTASRNRPAHGFSTRTRFLSDVSCQ